MITRMYWELKKLISPKIIEPVKNWATELNRTFLEKDPSGQRKRMKKYSRFLAIKEMQIKTTL
jgi:hypothetical protein